MQPLHSRQLSPALEAALDWVERLGATAQCELIIDSGTLLGLVRQGASLDGDLDIDLSIVDAEAIGRVLAALRPFRAKIWNFEGRPYRAEIPPGTVGSLAVEIKFFRRDGPGFTCPAVGFVSPGGSKDGSRKSLRSVLRPIWRAILARSDAGRFPMRRFARVDHWVVPSSFFDERLPLPARPHCVVPREAEAYLAYRYGAWRVPASDWVSWRDDGGYRASSPQMQAAQRLSPHRGRTGT